MHEGLLQLLTSESVFSLSRLACRYNNVQVRGLFQHSSLAYISNCLNKTGFFYYHIESSIPHLTKLSGVCKGDGL